MRGSGYISGKGKEILPLVERHVENEMETKQVSNICLSSFSFFPSVVVRILG